jgi:acyl carrier protein
LLQVYVQDLVAQAMGTSSARIDPQQSLRDLGLDSLIAVEVRNRINVELGMNVPLAKFMQGDASISALAAYAVQRLTESDRADRVKTSANGSGNGMMPAAQSSPPLTGAAAADLLERINELSEQEIDRHLSELAPEGRA